MHTRIYGRPQSAGTRLLVASTCTDMPQLRAWATASGSLTSLCRAARSVRVFVVVVADARHQEIGDDANKLAAAKLYYGMRCGDEGAKKQSADYFV